MDDAAMSAWLITVFVSLETPATMQKPGAVDAPGSCRFHQEKLIDPGMAA